MLKKSGPARFVDLAESEQAGFVKFKYNLSSPRIGGTPELPSFILDRDACDNQVCCVLIKPDDYKA